jgi:integrase/recombinase XerD
MAHKRPVRVVGDPSDPESLSVLTDAYLEDLAVRNYSAATVQTRRRDLRFFLAWCDERSLGKASEVTRPIVLSYQQHLFHYRKKNDEPLTFNCQHSRLTSVRLLFAWLAKTAIVPYNPAAELELPRVAKRLPKHVLTANEADRVIAQPDVNDALGLRDRAILETLYSTGMRRMELVHLELFDLDLERGTVVIRQGKGKKDRVVPVGERACRWVRKYVADVRPALVASPREAHVFLAHTGEAFTPDFLSRLVKGYVEKAEIGKTGSCHLFRHAMATLMLENGADIRYIQQMLGHASLETTEIYTHVSIRKLKEIHSVTHPSAKWEPFVPPERVEGPEPPRTVEGEPDRRYNRRRNELNEAVPLGGEPGE